MEKMYLAQAIQTDPKNKEILRLKDRIEALGLYVHDNNDNSNSSNNGNDNHNDNEDSQESDQDGTIAQQANTKIANKSPEQFYEVASEYFIARDFKNCANNFEISCQKSEQTLRPSCNNAVYFRNMIIDWGFNGT